jgi:hypothetical protein
MSNVTAFFLGLLLGAGGMAVVLTSFALAAFYIHGKELDEDKNTNND